MEEYEKRREALLRRHQQRKSTHLRKLEDRRAELWERIEQKRARKTPDEKLRAELDEIERIGQQVETISKEGAGKIADLLQRFDERHKPEGQ
jgi:hypothetical protein